MDRVIFWSGIVNLVLSPVVFLWQILYSFFSYAELIKRQPGALGMRRYSNYGRHYFRHFNELDHELGMRLNRGYRPAAQYMDMFLSRLGEILAKNLAFVSGAFFAVLFGLSVWDEDVLEIEHVLTAMTVCGFVVIGCRVFIADENLVWCPEWLMNLVVAQLHYCPDSWKGYAHTDRVRAEFGQMFQFKVYFLFEELMSPIVTPLLLLFWARPRAREFVEFFHRFTVNVEGLGDVCSFAQMDVRRHGDPQWNGGDEPPFDPQDPREQLESKANDGKIEMSLVHFTLTNPIWNPPPASTRFLHRLRQKADKDLESVREQQAAVGENALFQSIHSLMPLQYPFQFSRLGAMNPPQNEMRGQGIAHHEGPLDASSVQNQRKPSQPSLIDSLHQSGMLNERTSGSLFGSLGGGTATNERLGAPILDGAAAEMSINALYLHELHARRTRTQRNYGSMTSGISSHQAAVTGQANEGLGNLWAAPEESNSGAMRLQLIDESSNEMP